MLVSGGLQPLHRNMAALLQLGSRERRCCQTNHAGIAVGPGAYQHIVDKRLIPVRWPQRNSIIDRIGNCTAQNHRYQLIITVGTDKGQVRDAIVIHIATALRRPAQCRMIDNDLGIAVERLQIR